MNQVLQHLCIHTNLATDSDRLYVHMWMYKFMYFAPNVCRFVCTFLISPYGMECFINKLLPLFTLQNNAMLFSSIDSSEALVRLHQIFISSHSAAIWYQLVANLPIHASYTVNGGCIFCLETWQTHPDLYFNINKLDPPPLLLNPLTLSPFAVGSLKAH